jgi:hypothetical protein
MPTTASRGTSGGCDSIATGHEDVAQLASAAHAREVALMGALQRVARANPSRPTQLSQLAVFCPLVFNNAVNFHPVLRADFRAGNRSLGTAKSVCLCGHGLGLPCTQPEALTRSKRFSVVNPQARLHADRTRYPAAGAGTRASGPVDPRRSRDQ